MCDTCHNGEGFRIIASTGACRPRADRSASRKGRSSMLRRLSLLGLLVVALVPADARAQRRAVKDNYSGPAMTPFGPVYNPTQTPEYRLFARNPAAYQQLR